jgi:hypothetical protein
MITRDDLDWWHETAVRLHWIWAKTYAETAPHHYVVEGRTAGVTRDDFIRAGRVIHTFGRPAKFYGMTNLYLHSPDGRLKWWTMDADPACTTLINQATTDRTYGLQNAPNTGSVVETQYDAVATDYDATRPTDPVFADAARNAVTELAGGHEPSILDIGCGTGRVLDLGLTSPERYAGVDPSSPMLNRLVRKHPGVGAVYPMTIEQAHVRSLFTPGQFEIVTMLLDVTDEIESRALTWARSVASRGVIIARGADITVVPVDPSARG